ncbi:hypothetical protein AVEN_3818-1 [Araneus ventricosus]|uniref:Uncharacterized protein n=1 Tax=Araneus ventricosus TaxID=182803 RepID=A0A4Y2GPW3_ARAVE|nr:hypothetical protein AVEN_3818-1 [Araneus ventricosus]
MIQEDVDEWDFIKFSTHTQAVERIAKLVNEASRKDLMIADQFKRRVSSDVKDHFLDEWGELIDPLVLAGKLDQYESVRGNRKINPVRMAELKPLDGAKPTSPKRNTPQEVQKKQNTSLGNYRPQKGIGGMTNSSEERRQHAIFAIRPRTYHRIARN